MNISESDQGGVSMSKISVQDLRTLLKGDAEIALIDVREEGVFSLRPHLPRQSCIPLSHLELEGPRAWSPATPPPSS